MDRTTDLVTASTRAIPKGEIVLRMAGLLNDDDIYPTEENAMDLIYLAIVLIFFAATAALVYGFERLGRSE